MGFESLCLLWLVKNKVSGRHIFALDIYHLVKCAKQLP